jgi:hypothetical protein
VIRDLVAFQPKGKRTDLAAALVYAQKLLYHRSIVVVLSDFMAEGWERPLRTLGARHEVVAVSVEDPRERRLPRTGIIDLRDAESGDRRLVDARSASTRRRMQAKAVDLVALTTNTDYWIPLRRAFAQRARRLHRA